MSSKIEYWIVGRNMIDTWMNFVLESLLYDMTEIKKGKQVLNQNEFSLKIKNINRAYTLGLIVLAPDPSLENSQ